MALVNIGVMLTITLVTYQERLHYEEVEEGPHVEEQKKYGESEQHRALPPFVWGLFRDYHDSSGAVSHAEPEPARHEEL